MRQERIAKATFEDENLTTGEIVFSILCSGIACILGLVWLIQGKKKGGKMLAIAVITNLIIRVLMAISER